VTGNSVQNFLQQNEALVDIRLCPDPVPPLGESISPHAIHRKIFVVIHETGNTWLSQCRQRRTEPLRRDNNIVIITALSVLMVLSLWALREFTGLCLIKQSCPWVGLTHGLGLVGSGWVEIFHFLVGWVGSTTAKVRKIWKDYFNAFR